MLDVAAPPATLPGEIQPRGFTLRLGAFGWDSQVTLDGQQLDCVMAVRVDAANGASEIHLELVPKDRRTPVVECEGMLFSSTEYASLCEVLGLVAEIAAAKPEDPTFDGLRTWLKGRPAAKGRTRVTSTTRSFWED